MAILPNTPSGLPQSAASHGNLTILETYTVLEHSGSMTFHRHLTDYRPTSKIRNMASHQSTGAAWRGDLESNTPSTVSGRSKVIVTVNIGHSTPTERTVLHWT